MKNLQEQIKRMKSLMGEERLWGNLVDEKILTENRLLRNIVTAARNAKNIPVQTITRRAREALKYALKNSDVLARKASFNSMIGRIGGDVWESELREILVKVKIRSEGGRRVLSEGEIQSVLRDIAAKDKVILVALRDGKSGDDIVDALNSAQKEITFTKESVQDMVYMLYGNDVFILNKLGVRMKLRVIPDNELANNTDDVLRTMGYTDEEIKAAREASKRKVNPKPKKKKTTDEAPTIDKQKEKELSMKDQQAQVNIANAISPRMNRVMGDYYWKEGKGLRRKWKDSIWFRITETWFWKIRIVPKPLKWVADKTRKVFNRISPFPKLIGVGIGDAIVLAFKYSPIIMEAWAIKKLWADKVTIFSEDSELLDPSTWEFDLDYEGNRIKTFDPITGQAKWDEDDDTVLAIITDHFSAIVANNPISYSVYASGWGISKIIWDEEMAEMKKKMARWVRHTYLCCPERAAKEFDGGGDPLDNPTKGWPGCEMHGQEGFGCQFPDGPPDCDTLYNKVFIEKNVDGKTAAEVKFETDVIGAEDNWAERQIRKAKRQFEKRLGLEKDWASSTVGEIIPNSEKLCDLLGMDMDKDKIKEDVKEAMEEAKKQYVEKMAEIDYKRVNKVELSAEQEVLKLSSEGSLQCDDWKNSIVGGWWQPEWKDKFSNDYTGFSKCWCSDSSNLLGKEDLEQCIKGANKVCVGR